MNINTLMIENQYVYKIIELNLNQMMQAQEQIKSNL